MHKIRRWTVKVVRIYLELRMRAVLVSGALKVAVGPELDKAGAKTYPVGSFLYVPANVQHTMGTDVDTICIGTALGPGRLITNMK